MGERDPITIVVLGAGPTGLSVAWNLVRDGYRVIVLEKEPVCGGQSITFEKNGYRYDLGPHNIHSRRESIIRFLQESLKGGFVKHDFHAEIYFQKKRIKYPFFGDDLLRSVSPLTALHCGFSFLGSRVKTLVRPGFKNDASYEAWIVNRFGRKMFDLFFGPYSEKVWGISTRELSNIVAQKRIPLRSISELLHSVIFKTDVDHPENPRTVDCFYPKAGIGTISNFFVKGITERGGRIVTGARVESLTLEDDHITRVIYSKDNRKHHIDLSPDGYHDPGMVISTIPVNDLVLGMAGQVPSVVREAAGELDFTAEVFLYLNINHPDVFGLPLFYFSEPEFPFNRIYDVGVFSKNMVPMDKTALCLEMSCTVNDGIWQADDDTLFENCIAPLEKHRLLQREDIEGYHTRRLSHAYPRFRVGFERRIGTLLGFIENHVFNLTTLGRQGLFTYANVDDALFMGFEVAKHQRYRNRFHLYLKDLLPDYINT